MPSDPSGQSGPGGWTVVVGQEKVKAVLRAAIRKRRLAHAYLFSGREGSGTDAMAVALASVLLCEKGGEDACGNCRSCRLAGSLQHPDLFLHFALPVGRNEGADDDPIAKLTQDDLEAVRSEVAAKAAEPYHAISMPRARQIKINSIRQMRRQASMGSFAGGKKVFILFDADRMSTEASNALLKTLEEPTPGTLIILTSAEPESLLPTVVSRCQHLRFDPVDESQITSALLDRRGVDEPRARLVGRLAGGSYSRALRLLDEDLSGKRDRAVDLLRSFMYKGRRDVMETIDRTGDLPRTEAEEMFLILQTWLRDAMLLSAGGSAEVNLDDASTLGKFVSKHGGFDYPRAIGAIDTAVADLSKNVYIHLILHALGAEFRLATGGTRAVRT